MSSSAPYTFKQLITEIIATLAKSISERHGETPRQQAERFHLATQMVLAFFPRDVVEIALGCRVVLFHELTLDAVRELLRGQTPPMQRSTRANIVALDRCFHANLAKLEHYQTRRAEGTHGEATQQRPEPAAAQAAPEDGPSRQAAPPPDQVTRNASSPAPVSAAAPTAAPNGSPAPETLVPPPAAVAALQRNEVALEALAANDPIAFAKAMGIENPSTDPATAAAQWAELFDTLTEADDPAGKEQAAAE